MKVRCLRNRASQLTGRYAQGFGQLVDFDLAVGREYTVYAIGLYHQLVEYLIEGECGRPSWYPAVLFEVTENRLPGEWRFGFHGQDADVEAVLGYEEIAEDHKNIEALFDRDVEAFRIWFRRKK